MTILRSDVPASFFSPISQTETTSFDIYIYTIETGGIFRPNVFLSDHYKNGNIGRNLKDKGKSHMNETIELLKKHVSVRQFLDKKDNITLSFLHFYIELYRF